MKVLSKRQILMLHSMLMEQSGGMKGLRDEGLLDSAIHLPLQTFGGQELYPTILEKAARLGYGLIHNHPFTGQSGFIRFSADHPLINLFFLSAHANRQTLVANAIGFEIFESLFHYSVL